jgi:hypothetical protein
VRDAAYSRHLSSPIHPIAESFLVIRCSRCNTEILNSAKKLKELVAGMAEIKA